MVVILLVLIYIAFISLGLPDGLFGAAWPILRGEIDRPQEMGGIYSAVTCSATIFSSLFASRLIHKLGTGRILVISVVITSVSLFIFPLHLVKFIPTYVYMCADGFILGLGGGCVDAALNNYVALHFKARHMNFLHCFWGVGCMISPLVLSVYLSGGGSWQQTYYSIAIAQFVLAVVLLFSVPLWGKVSARKGINAHISIASNPVTAETAVVPDETASENAVSLEASASEKSASPAISNSSDSSISSGTSASSETSAYSEKSAPLDVSVPSKNSASPDTSVSPQVAVPRHLSNLETLKLPFIKTSIIAFFCYCGYENSMILWIASFLIEVDGFSAPTAAIFSSLFFIGITGGRFISGVLSEKIGMKNLVRWGCVVAVIGIIIVLLPTDRVLTGIGTVLVGAGAGPFYPGMMYRTPESFGAEASPSAIGLQMACAYAGSTFMPLFLGILPLSTFPIWILILTLITFILTESLNYRKKKRGIVQIR
jgi:fucose permease